MLVGGRGPLALQSYKPGDETGGQMDKSEKLLREALLEYRRKLDDGHQTLARLVRAKSYDSACTAARDCAIYQRTAKAIEEQLDALRMARKGEL